MKEKKNWSERPIPSLIISILGLIVIIFALANLFELVQNPIKNYYVILGILLMGLLWMYPIFKKKK